MIILFVQFPNKIMTLMFGIENCPSGTEFNVVVYAKNEKGKDRGHILDYADCNRDR